MMGSYFILCVFLASFCGVIATPVKDSDNVTTSETNKCDCSHDNQLYTDVKELREELARVNALLNSQQFVKLMSDEPPNINTRAVFPNVVGFTADLNDHVHDLPVGSTVIYDRIYYNAGGHYDSSTGVFTCPQNGLYLFSVFVESFSASSVSTATVGIVINGQQYAVAVSEPTQYGHDASGGDVLVHHLQQGDRVWVETYQHDNQDLTHAFNSFSGVLIQSTD
ncbi:positive regulation of adiponectin secretion [Mactra antiquata]